MCDEVIVCNISVVFLRHCVCVYTYIHTHVMLFSLHIVLYTFTRVYCTYLLCILIYYLCVILA